VYTPFATVFGVRGGVVLQNHDHERNSIHHSPLIFSAMTKTRENIITRNLHGKLGDQVIFRRRYGKSFMTDIPKQSAAPASQRQIQHRDRFRLASLWAKSILTHPDAYAAYAEKAVNGRTPYIVAVTDYLKPPRISTIDIGTYSGHVNNVIRVAAFDDFAVRSVSVRIRDAGGTLIEEGECHPDGMGMYWLYTATEEVADVTGVQISAKATDNPGNCVESTVVHD